MEAAPDFWGNHSAMAVYLKTTDRLDRKNLPMLYHLSYDPPYPIATFGGGTGILSPSLQPTAPVVQNRSDGYADLDARLDILRIDNRRTTAPMPPMSDNTISPKPMSAPRPRAASSDIYAVPTLSTVPNDTEIANDKQFERLGDVFPGRLIH